MANMNSTQNNGNPPVPFSYAQAAMGKTTAVHSSTPPNPAPTQTESKEKSTKTPPLTNGNGSLSWADDATDANTIVEDNTTQMSAAPDKLKLNALAQSMTTEQNGVSKPHESRPPSPISGPVSSSATAKGEESSPSQMTNDNAWASPQESASSNRIGEEESKPEQASTKQDVASAVKILKEAPAPAVNFWTQRAKEAQAKQSFPTIPTSQSNHNVALTHQERTNSDYNRPKKKDNDPNGPMHKASIESSPVETRYRARGDSTAGRGRAGSHYNGSSDARKFHSNRQGVANQTLSIGDTLSWPTPEKVQDEDRKKVQEKIEKTDPERANNPISKPHSKNEWVPIPFTPSVKFETPIPTGGKRGGRPSQRGGRDVNTRRGTMGTQAPAGRSQIPSNPATPPDGEIDHTARGRMTSSPTRSSSLPAKARRALNASQSRNDDIPQRHPSLPDNVGVNAGGEFSSNRDAHFSSTKLNSGTEQSNAQSNRFGNDKLKRDSINSSFERDGPRQTAGSGVNTASSNSNAAKQRSRKPPSQNDGNVHGNTNAHDSTNRSVSDPQGRGNGSKTQRNERRHDQSEAVHELNDHALSFSQRDRQEGRSDRTKSSKGDRRGHYGNNQSSSTSQYPQNHSGQAMMAPSYAASSPKPPFFNAGYQPYAINTSRSYRNGPRSAPISAEQYYQPASVVYPNQAQQSPYFQGPFDYAMLNQPVTPATAPYMAPLALMNGVANQLNYYFSVDNLCKDVFLRKFMDSQGFVALSLIADFKRMRNLTQDVNLIRLVGAGNPGYEMRTGTDGGYRIRKREGWEKFVLSMEERDPSAQNDGPPASTASLDDPSSAYYPSYNDAMNMGRPPISPLDPNSFPTDAFLPSPTSFEPAPAVSANGTNYRPKSNRYSMPTFETSLASVNNMEQPTSTQKSPKLSQDDSDSFPDEKIDMLTVVVRPVDSNSPLTPVHVRDSRTFSNGSIDVESTIDDIALGEEHKALSSTKSVDTEDNPPKSNDVEEHDPLQSPSERPGVGPNVTLFWLKEKERPEHQLKGSQTEGYLSLRMKALQQRQLAAEGTCPHDMDILYKFWSHFLIRNFNTRMYEEFRTCAYEDVSNRKTSTGMTNLVKYYGEALASQNAIRRRVAEDYIDIVKKEEPSKDRPAFQQLRAAWRNGALNLKNRKRISEHVDSELRSKLER